MSVIVSAEKAVQKKNEAEKKTAEKAKKSDK